jgi:hypothetical protein
MTNLLPIACHIGILQKWDIKGFRTCKEGYRRTVKFALELLVSLRTPLTPQPPLRILRRGGVRRRESFLQRFLFGLFLLTASFHIAD